MVHNNTHAVNMSVLFLLAQCAGNTCFTSMFLTAGSYNLIESTTDLPRLCIGGCIQTQCVCP
jgi:hypothetical protein